MSSRGRIIYDYLFRIFINLLLWVFLALITVELPWWVFKDSGPAAATATFKIGNFLDWNLWCRLIVAAAVVAALLFLVSKKDEAKYRHQFVNYLLEDVFGVIINAASLLAVCSLWMLNPLLMLIAAASYLFGLRFWYLLLPSP
ncbi:hypothetical protein [Xanthomonas sp. GPE 39]|uniref:hypothetical protein n=1 Tax=Xanthomonas sp. GPE 39 TaxID=1583099 RepID=UPI0005F2C1B5|nr:hypothetical protein [Xanthomonas sp. GPE 39]